MKKKFLIGGGITALVAVIAVIAVFAQGGTYFKGFTIVDMPSMDEIMGDYPNPGVLGDALSSDGVLGDPIVDFCSNIEGIQSSIPSGYEIVDGICIMIELGDPIVDFCSNIEGIQSLIPSGYEATGGICTKIIIPTEDFECGQWTDVSSSDKEYDMWMYLCEKGIVKGNADGTLRPESKLNRAELLALAFRASEYENIYNVSENASDCFPDVDDEWFAKYVCTAKNKGFIKGYDDGKAKPERNVILAEGLKIFLGGLDEPFDASASDCWYCNMVDDAGDDGYVPYSFDDPKQVGPIELTRRKAFNMIYRIMLYR